MSKWISRIITVLAVLTLLFKGSDWLIRRSGSIPAVPDPNAYTTLLSLAESAPEPNQDLADIGPAEVRRIAEEQRRTLQALHAALSLDSGVPLGSGRLWADTHEREIQRLKRVAALWGLQSRAHLLDGQTNRAVDAVVDIVALGHVLSRGGGRTDVIHGLTVETIGAALLRGLVPATDVETARRAARTLERLEDRRQTIERTLEIEHAWKNTNFGVVGAVGDFMLRQANAKRNADFQDRHQRAVGRSRRAMLALAARAVELETGQAPSSPTQLVPAVLQAVPIDPATGKAFDRLPPVGEN